MRLLRRMGLLDVDYTAAYTMHTAAWGIGIMSEVSASVVAQGSKPAWVHYHGLYGLCTLGWHCETLISDSRYSETFYVLVWNLVWNHLSGSV